MKVKQTTPINPLKRALKRRDKQIGIWLTLGTSSTTEVLAGAGYDWMLIDMEHTSSDPAQVLEMLRAGHGGTAEPVVRIPWRDPVLMKRLLDIGVRSFMIPFVQNADEAAQIVSSTRYPPVGTRGVNGTMRASLYGRATDYGQRYADEICLIVQAETPLALANIESISAVEGIDAVFIGPNDLAANMGFYGQPGAPQVRAAIGAALEGISAGGSAAGILNFNTAQARELLDAGFCLLAVGSDVGLLARNADALCLEFADYARAEGACA